MKKTLIASILSTLFLTACVGNKQDNSAVLTDSGLNPQNFVTDINGKKTGLFVLKNKKQHGSVCYQLRRTNRFGDGSRP